MKNHPFLTVLAALALAGLLLTACDNGTGQGRNPTGPAASDSGESAASTSANDHRPLAPDFTLANYDGKQISLHDFRGKYVVLEWINPNCPYVRDQYKAGTFKRLAEQFADKGVVWLAINSTHSNSPDKSRQWAQEHQLPYPILDDSSGQVGKKYQAKTTPHMFVIDPTGHIIYNGAIDDNPAIGQPCKVNYVEQCLNQALAGQPVTVPVTKPYGCSVKYAK